MGIWDDRSKKIIQEVFDENPDATLPEMKKLLTANYPFGQRAMWPYKAWLKATKQMLMARYPEMRSQAQEAIGGLFGEVKE